MAPAPAPNFRDDICFKTKHIQDSYWLRLHVVVVVYFHQSNLSALPSSLSNIQSFHHVNCQASHVWANYFVPMGWLHASFEIYLSLFPLIRFYGQTFIAIRNHSVSVSDYMVIWWYVNNMHSFAGLCLCVPVRSPWTCSYRVIQAFPPFPVLSEHTLATPSPRSHVIFFRRIVRSMYRFLHSVPTSLHSVEGIGVPVPVHCYIVTGRWNRNVLLIDQSGIDGLDVMNCS